MFGQPERKRRDFRLKVELQPLNESGMMYIAIRTPPIENAITEGKFQSFRLTLKGPIDLIKPLEQALSIIGGTLCLLPQPSLLLPKREGCDTSGIFFKSHLHIFARGLSLTSLRADLCFGVYSIPARQEPIENFDGRGWRRLWVGTLHAQYKVVGGRASICTQKRICTIIRIMLTLVVSCEMDTRMLGKFMEP